MASTKYIDGYEQLSQARKRMQVKQIKVHVGSALLGETIILSSLYCLNSNMEPTLKPTMRPSYAAGSPTPKPTVFSGVQFTASQVDIDMYNIYWRTYIIICVHAYYYLHGVSFTG